MVEQVDSAVAYPPSPARVLVVVVDSVMGVMVLHQAYHDRLPLLHEQRQVIDGCRFRNHINEI